ncbi:MAG: molecular chaperone TorD family protein [Thermoleophilia bacterium]|nr:molecular chaperone TorD family protein [Thermoleophilia bacterium]
MTVATEPAVGRAAAWRLLSLGLAPPTEETMAEVRELAEALLALERTERTAGLLRAVRDLALADGQEERAAAYQRLFGGRVRVPPYEGSYELDPIRQGRQMADVAAFYRAFGAEAAGPVAERPDHVGCELEFLSFLELRRLEAEEEGREADAAVLDDVAASFLRDHAGRWLPTFFAELHAAAGEAPLYGALAALGRTLLDGELARRGLEPTPLLCRHPRSAVEREVIECG